MNAFLRLSGGGATATDEHGVKTGKQYEGDKMDCCKGIHAAHGGAGGPASHDTAEPPQNVTPSIAQDVILRFSS